MSRRIQSAPWLRAVDDNSASTAEARPLTDEELIEAVVSGDTRAASAIHDRLIDVIDHSLFRVLGRRDDDHDDLVQNCFEQVLRTLTGRAFAGNCSLRTWAGRITTNVALNTLRSRIRERKVFSRGLDSHELEACAPIDSRDRTYARLELDKVRQVLAQMRTTKSEVLILHDVHGYNLNEIAVMLDVTVAAAQSRLVRGRTEFKKRLASMDSSRRWS